MSAPASAEERLIAEAVRVYRRYAVEIVEGVGFCPYAQRARVDSKTRETVVLEAIPSDELVLDRIEALAEQPEIELAVVIFPRLTVSRRRLGRWVEVLRKAHTATRAGDTVLAIEGFHPDAEADLSSPERLTPFVRRTPDPTLQLTRLDALERVRRGSPQGTGFFDPSTMSLDALLEDALKRPLHERIAELNHEAITRLGVADVRARMDAILRDRDAAYAAIDPSVPLRMSAP